MARPLVAVPAYPRLRHGKVEGWTDEGLGLPVRYVDALRRADAQEAVFLPERLSEVGDVADLLARVDGLLLAGGGDLDPATYGASVSPTVYGMNTARDACELALIRAALDLEVPTLAICRGHQVLAVALGATLDQHITGRDGLLHHGVPGVADGARLHDVDLEPGSRLAAAMGTARSSVSSHHHQAVTSVGAKTRVVAQAPDGVIEGLELAAPRGPWIVGVQWHPEDTAASDPAQQRLFDAFAEQCLAARSRPREPSSTR